MAFEQWPYTNLHDLNLDWILEKVKEMESQLTAFSVNFPHVSDKNGGEWSPEYNYDTNEIVFTEQTIYIAKGAVPIGAAITNTDYWLKVADINVDITDFEERLAEAEQSIENLENTTEILTNRRYILMGDSWGTNNTFDGYEGVVEGWCDKVKRRLDVPASDCYIIARSGAGFVRPENNFAYNLQNAIATIEHPESITDIVIMSGLNDTYYPSYSEINEGMNNLHGITNTVFPNAKVWVIAGGWTLDASRKIQLGYVFNNYQRLAGVYGFSFHTGISEYCTDRSLFVPGNSSHITDLVNVANNIMAIITGSTSGFYAPYPPSNVTLQYEENKSTTFCTICQYKDQKYIRIINHGWLTFTTPINITSYAATYLGSLSGNLLDGGKDNNALLYTSCCIICGSSAIYNVPVCVIFDQDAWDNIRCKCYFMFTGEKLGNANRQVTISNVTRIVFDFGEASYPIFNI